MSQNQNAEITYLFDSLDLYRIKYLKLLNEGKTSEELSYCQKAIQFYLSAIDMVKRSAQQHKNHFSFSLRSFFIKFKSLIKSKPDFESLNPI